MTFWYFLGSVPWTQHGLSSGIVRFRPRRLLWCTRTLRRALFPKLSPPSSSSDWLYEVEQPTPLEQVVLVLRVSLPNEHGVWVDVEVVYDCVIEEVLSPVVFDPRFEEAEVVLGLEVLSLLPHEEYLVHT